MNTKNFLDSVKPLEAQPEEKLLKLVEAERTVSALSSVVNYIITDAFNLTSEESFWIGMLLNNSLEPLKTIIPRSTLGAVRQELQAGTYSQRLFERANLPANATSTLTPTYDENVEYASVSEWTEGIGEIILSGYPHLRPMLKSRIIGSVFGIFRELGVGETKNSRPSLYLPTNIRFLLRKNESEN